MTTTKWLFFNSKRICFSAGHGGGILLSLAGRGFSESLNISVCDHPCTVQTVDFNELICLLPPSQSIHNTVLVHVYIV